MATPIFINRTKYEANKESMTGAEVLALAGFAVDHDLFLLKGEGDPTGGAHISPEQVVQIRAGEHFRAIPGNRNFG